MEGGSRASSTHARAGTPEDVERAEPAKGPLFSLEGLDLSACLADRAEIERWNPHRHTMNLLDRVVWLSDDLARGVALKHTRANEFWVEGHFPGRPMFPGVLMIEAGAQVACYLFSRRKNKPTLAAFLRIEQASFRSMVVPGDELYLLCQDVKFQRKRFVCDIQGLVGGERLAFDARISGMSME